MEQQVKLEEIICPICKDGVLDGNICPLCLGYGILFRLFDNFKYNLGSNLYVSQKAV